MSEVISNNSYSFEKDGIIYYVIKNGEGVEYPIFYIEKNENYGYFHINDEIVSKIDIGVVKEAIAKACYALSSRIGITPVIVSNKFSKQIDTVDPNTLISNIKPITFDGSINLDEVSTINECIEPPLRKACQELNAKGIKTIMSSCNFENVETRNTKISTYRVGKGFDQPPFFIGNGYAWIIIDWECLSNENKAIFIDYNSGKRQIPLGERESAILQHNCTLDDPKIPISWQMVRFFEVINFYKYYVNPSNFGKLEQKSEYDTYFDSHRNGMLSQCSLNNVSDDYRIVVLRYPIDELTTVGNVEKFFANFIRQLSNQKINKNKTDTTLKV